MEKDTYKIKLKQGNVEFEVSGDKDFVIKSFEELKSMVIREPISQMLEKKSNQKISKMIIEKEDLELDIDLPLDAYLNRFNVSGLQRKFLAIMLYLIEVKHLSSFRSRDVNNILKENNFEPFQASATHIQRLRDKGLLSIIGKEGNESMITIYKDNINEAKNYIKLKDE